MSGGKGGGERLVVDYFMSIHYGICHGPVDALLGIYVKERDAWPGKTAYDDDEDFQNGDYVISFKAFIESLNENNSPTRTEAVAVDSGGLTIDRLDLFGGDTKEGGVQGTALYMKGDLAQEPPALLAHKLGLTPETCPAYRGVASVLFYQTENKGFLWSQNNPYLPPAWFTIFRRPVGLNAFQATIQRGEYPPDANPAHIIYECLTNSDWGMGAATTSIDVSSFEAAGDALYWEGFGLSMLWSQQSSIEDFIKEVLDHIQATLFLNPRTGLITLKLIRGGYDPDLLQQFNPDNCNAINRQRKAWAETINEINVTWTNPANEQEETVTFQDLANISMQGGVVSDTRNYYGVRNAELASELGVRDLRSSSYPLFTCDIEVNRQGWSLLPGDVCKLSWPEDGLENIIMRVGAVDYGRPGSGTVKASLVEDVFALELATWVHPPTTGWVPPDSDPMPMAYTGFFTVPYPALVRAGISGEAADSQYPRVFPGIMAQQNDYDTYEYVLNGTTLLPNGDTIFGPLGTFAQTSYSETSQTIPRETTSTILQSTLGIVLGTETPTPGSFIMIGDGDGAEMCLLMSYNAGARSWVVRRGIYDTVPRAWPIGTPVWYIPLTGVPVDTSERIAGQTVQYRLQSRTSKGLLPLDAAPQESFVLSERPYLPFRPANVSVGGSDGFGTRVYTSAPETIPTTWANRNRLTEDQVVRAWTDGNVTPEEGQTTTVVMSRQNGEVLATHSGLEGTSFSVPYEDVQGYGFVNLTFFAERDGLLSMHGLSRLIHFDLDGYGNNYGNDYGGTS